MGYDLEGVDVAVEVGNKYKSEFKKISFAIIPFAEVDYGCADLMTIFVTINERRPLEEFQDNHVAVKNLRE